MRLWALILKELLVLRKDLHGLLVLFIMPAVFILIMSLAMRDTFSDNRQVAIEFLLHDADQSTLSAKVREQLAGLDGFVLREDGSLATEQAQDRAVAADRYKFAVVIPDGFGAQLVSTTAADKDDLALLVSPTVNPQLRALFRIAVLEAVEQVRAEEVISRLSPRERVAYGSLQQGLQPGSVSMAERFVYQGGQPPQTPTSVQQSVPAWLVFAMFFVVIPLSTAFIIERQQGSLLRLRIMNVSSVHLMAGKVVPYYVVNQVQMVLMILVGIYLVPHFGGDRLTPGSSWGGLLLISSATSLAAISFALLITTLAKTHVQATTLGGVSNIIFGALGGVMVPKFVMPPFMREVANVSPMSWGLEGFLDIFLRNGRWQEVVPEAGALLLFAATCLVVAMALFSREGRDG